MTQILILLTYFAIATLLALALRLSILKWRNYRQRQIEGMEESTPPENPEKSRALIRLAGYTFAVYSFLIGLVFAFAEARYDVPVLNYFLLAALLAVAVLALARISRRESTVYCAILLGSGSIIFCVKLFLVMAADADRLNIVNAIASVAMPFAMVLMAANALHSARFLGRNQGEELLRNLGKTEG